MSKKQYSKSNFMFESSVDFEPFVDTPMFQEHGAEAEGKPKEEPNDGNLAVGQTPGKRQFNSVAYSGKAILNHPFWGNLIFDLDNIRAKADIPILMNHDHEKIVGQGQLSIVDNQVIVNGSLFSNMEDGQKVAKLADNGFRWQQSVHIEPSVIDKINQGQKAQVNGQTIDGPATIFRNSVIKESSFVALGADSRTSANVFNDLNQKIEVEERKMTEKIKKEEKKEVSKHAFMISTDAGLVPAAEGTVIGEYTVTKEDFDFACSCEEKTKKDDGKSKKMSEDNDKLKAEIKELKALIAKGKKDKRMSLISDLETALGSKFEESQVNAFSSMDDDIFTTTSGLMMEKLTKNVNSKLFSVENSEKNTKQVNLSSPIEISNAAKSLQKEFSDKGKSLDYSKAIEMVTTVQ